MSSDSLGEAAQKFRDAEIALREVIGAAESLRSVQDDLKDATRSLGAGERVLRDSGDAVYQLAHEMKEIARDLAAAVEILKKARIEELGSRQEAIQQSQGLLVRRVNLTVALAGLGALFGAASAILVLVK